MCSLLVFPIRPESHVMAGTMSDFAYGCVLALNMISGIY